MPEPIAITFDEAGKAVLDRVRAFPAQLLPAIARGMNKGNELMLGQISAQRFTGKGPFPVGDHRLGVVSNRLRSSLRRSRASVDGDTVTATVGSNVAYFGVHEFGFAGSVQVKAHQRKSPLSDRFAVGGQLLARGKATAAVQGSRQLAESTIRRKLGESKVSSGIARVKAHTRNVDLPAREPLATGIRENQQILTATIIRSVISTFSGTGLSDT